MFSSFNFALTYLIFFELFKKKSYPNYKVTNFSGIKNHLKANKLKQVMFHFIHYFYQYGSRLLIIY